MAVSNLGTVVRFEIARTLTKPRFWVATLFVPVLIGVVFGLVAAAGGSTSNATEQQATARFAFEYSDASGLVNPTIAQAAGGTKQADPAQGIADVRGGKIAAFFAFPALPAKQTIKISAQDVGVFNNGKYAAVAQAVLTSSVEQQIGKPQLSTILATGIHTQTATYKNGMPSGGVNAIIAPLAYAVLFFMVLVILGQQMVSATLEEKENRVTEMILTTIEARSLIIGKIISLFAVGIIQMLVFAIPIATAFVFLRGQLNFGSFDLSSLTFDPARMVIGAVILVGGFALFTGGLVAIGAIMPTAKDANQIFAALMISVIIPIYITTLIVSDPTSPVVQIFTFFPFTAPMTALIRNGLGSLDGGAAAIVIAELYLAAMIALWLAIQLFKSGSIEYSRRVDIRRVFERST